MQEEAGVEIALWGLPLPAATAPPLRLRAGYDPKRGFGARPGLPQGFVIGRIDRVEKDNGARHGHGLEQGTRGEIGRGFERAWREAKEDREGG